MSMRWMLSEVCNHFEALSTGNVVPVNIELKGIGKVRENDPVPYQMAVDCMAGRETTVASVQSAISDTNLSLLQMQPSISSQASLSNIFNADADESISGDMLSTTDGTRTEIQEGKPLLSKAQQLLKKAVLVLGPAHCIVVNTTATKLCVVTFNRTDLFFTNYSQMYAIDSGQSTRVEALSDPNGLFVAIIYKAVDNFLHYKRWHCGNGTTLTVLGVNTNEIQVSGEGIELKGIGKVKEDNPVPFQIAIDALANRLTTRASIQSALVTPLRDVSSSGGETQSSEKLQESSVGKQAQEFLKRAVQSIAHSSCYLINRTNGAICVITFSKADIFLTNYSNLYIIEQGSDAKVEALWDINGLFVAVIFKAADSSFHYKRWLCANDTQFTVTFMRKYDIHVEGSGIELKGVGKLKVNDAKSFRIVADSLNATAALPSSENLEKLHNDLADLETEDESNQPVKIHVGEANSDSMAPKETPPTPKLIAASNDESEGCRFFTEKIHITLIR